ncbi:GGDEF domain-containing protein [Sphingomonas beigongshangi]|uniref:GGDEF domain-containing protein n=1 Tax=Sphingomonas beigongshangi TaxID=2782540 RepID=UPI00193B5F7C|nr:sensor domain-containing diguanylate cyclase [Sphingomonas beigongshangi]
MTKASSHDEAGRLAALRRLDVLDTAPEEQFEKIVGLVRAVLGVPIATVTLVDAHRQWFKARHGMPVSETPRSTSFCTHTVAARAPLMIADATLDSRVSDSPLVVGKPFIRAYLGVPLMTPDGHAVGALCAIDTTPRTFSSAQIEVLAGFARLVVDELELRQVAVTDQLTGCLSRRGFLAAVDSEIERCRRYDRSASLAILDVDHFKRVNDTFGHAAGDAVLRQLVLRCTTTLRPVDLVGRLGGEEFAILLPETGQDAATLTIERLRACIAGVSFEIGTAAALSVTASFGLARFVSGDRPDGWLERADGALYAAKRGGRNRVNIANYASTPAAA